MTLAGVEPATHGLGNHCSIRWATGPYSDTVFQDDKNQHIKHVGKLATFLVGGYDSKTNGNLDKFCSECQKIGLDMRFKTNIKEKPWWRFIQINN